MTAFPWPALALARARDEAARIPFLLPVDAAYGSAPIGSDRPGHIVLGSVALAHLDALRDWPDAFEFVADGASPTPRAVMLRLAPPGRDARLDHIHRDLHAQGLIPGWREETYPLRDRRGGTHGTIERAACRFWGLLTFGAHCNGHVVGVDGRPSHLWIARRARTKPTDPGRLDNLVGGGVPIGQTPREAVIREAWEEAGLEPAQMAGLVTGSTIELDGDVPEGRQHEWLHVFDLALPADFAPRAVDGEVAEHRLMPVDEAFARAGTGELTTDAALATFDFGLRHGLLAASNAMPGSDAPAGSARAIRPVTPVQVAAFEALRRRSRDGFQWTS